MHRLLMYVVALLLAFSASCVSASKEGVLPLSEFAISSQGIGSSGPVRVSGTQTSQGISRLKIEAFGREFVAPTATIGQLQGFLANGMLLSYEHGYPEVGGRTVYLSFFKGFTSGLTETRGLSVNETGVFQLLKDVGL